jgi:membrane fusion protein (multidrug efflux system)
MHRALTRALLIAALALPGTTTVQAQLAPTAGAKSSAPVEVGVVTLHPQAVPVTAELPGRVSASQTADVRPQVGGVVKSIDFKPGAEVKAGDVLFEIEDAAFQAQVAVASAAEQKAEAAVSTAQAQVNRDKQLLAGGGVAQSDFDNANATLIEAQADVAGARANLQTAQLSLSLAKVTAPISGLISDTTVTQGALVTAAQTTALATVRLLDPIYVDLVETSANLLKVRAQFESGSLKGNRGQPLSVSLVLEDGTAYPDKGQVTLADVVVSESTGTFSLRATFPNSRRLLLPGMFVRATVDLGTEPNDYLVPQRAVTFDAAGNATALFAEDGKAVSHILTTDGSIGNDWRVTKGPTDGAQLIVDGFQKISDGSAVKPLAVTIDANGVVKQTIASTAAAPAATATKPAN